MRIWVNPDKLANLGVTVTDISNAVKAQNKVNPAGQIGGEPVPAGQEYTYNVRAPGRLPTAEEFGEIVVRAHPDGSILRLKDVRGYRWARNTIPLFRGWASLTKKKPSQPALRSSRFISRPAATPCKPEITSSK